MLSRTLAACAGTGFIFIMSIAGASMVLFSGSCAKIGRKSLLMGFTAGVMSAAAVWSLLIPAIEQQGAGTLPCWLPAAAGIFLGGSFISGLDAYFLRRKKALPIDRSAALLVSSITLHNIPEGMAVGLAFALAVDGESFAAACALSMGIGIQNLPEGAAVSLPLREFGLGRGRAFTVGILSAAVEPLFGIGAVLIAGLVHPIMPWLLSFAAGAMLYVCAHELLPEAQGRAGAFSYISGFALMMVLDVALG